MWGRLTGSINSQMVSGYTKCITLNDDMTGYDTGIGSWTDGLTIQNIKIHDNIIINGCQGIDMCAGMGNVVILNNLISIGRINNNLISKLQSD